MQAERHAPRTPRACSGPFTSTWRASSNSSEGRISQLFGSLSNYFTQKREDAGHSSKARTPAPRTLLRTPPEHGRCLGFAPQQDYVQLRHTLHKQVGDALIGANSVAARQAADQYGQLPQPADDSRLKQAVRGALEAALEAAGGATNCTVSIPVAPTKASLTALWQAQPKAWQCQLVCMLTPSCTVFQYAAGGTAGSKAAPKEALHIRVDLPAGLRPAGVCKIFAGTAPLDPSHGLDREDVVFGAPRVRLTPRHSTVTRAQ